MEDIEFDNQEIENTGGYTPSEETMSEDIPQPSNDYIPLDDSVTEDVIHSEDVSMELGISDEDINTIAEKPVTAFEEASNDEDNNEMSLGRKCCPTRHGCQGATDCDYAYGNYPF